MTQQLFFQRLLIGLVVVASGVYGGLSGADWLDRAYGAEGAGLSGTNGVLSSEKAAGTNSALQGENTNRGVQGQDKAEVSGIVPVQMSKETTYLLVPGRTDGTIGYTEALDEIYGKDLVSSDNAAVGLLGLLGLPEDLQVSAEVMKKLGIEGVGSGGRWVWLRQSAERGASAEDLAVGDDGKTSRIVGKAESQLAQAGREPWDGNKYPLVAKWLDENRRTMDSAAEVMGEKTKFYVPLESGTVPLFLPRVVLPHLPVFNQLAQAYTVRAMQRLKTGYVEGAVQDVVAVYRLGRLLKQAPVFLSQVTGMALEMKAADTVTMIARHGGLSAALAQKILGDIRSVSQGELAGGKSMLGERLMLLDSAQILNHAKVWKPVARSVLGTVAEVREGQVMPMDAPMAVDVNVVMSTINKAFDQAEKALQETEYFAAARELDIVSYECNELRREQADKIKDQAFVDAYLKADVVTKRQMLTPVLEALYAKMIPNLARTRMRSLYTLKVKLALADVAVGLAGYYADKGEYPQRLDELTPGYLKRLPRDYFVDRPFIYVNNKTSVTVYSVGANMADDQANPQNQLDLVIQLSVPKKSGE